MPHKRNPQLTDDCVAISAQIRTLLPLAVESTLHDHEVSGGHESMMDHAIQQACVLTGDLLVRLNTILAGLELDRDRMRANLDLSGGLISSEHIMLTLGETVGRQVAHEIVYDAAQAAARGNASFLEQLAADPRITAHLSPTAIRQLLDPASNLGLSTQLAHQMARAAHKQAAKLSAIKQVQPLVVMSYEPGGDLIATNIESISAE